MNNSTITSVIEPASSTEKQTNKSTANENCKNQAGGREHSFKNIAILTSGATTYRQRHRLYEMEARKDSLTPLQRATIQRAKYEDLYGVRVTPAVLEFDADGKGKECFEIFKYVAVDLISSGYFEYLSNLARGDSESDLGTLKICYSKQFLAATGFFDLRSHTFRAAALCGPDTLHSFIDFVGSRPEVFILLFNKELDRNLRKDPIPTLVSLLELLGLRLIQVESKTGGEVWYKLDEARLNLLMAMTHAEFSGPGMIDEPPEYWENEEPVDWEAAMKNWIPE